jgi:hypothetical protein
MTATPLDYEQEALKCETAISELVAGRLQSYSIAGRSFTRNDMNTLRSLAEYFRRRYAETTYGAVTYADMSGGSE